MGTNKEQIATAATDEPAVPATSGPSLPSVHPSDQLTEDLFAPALGCGADIRPGWTQREDGWTPERIRIFLTALAQCGVVGAAARAAGMNRQSAYALRASARGRPFDLAWRAASQIAMQRLRDELVSRAINGFVEVTIRDGGVREERHRFDNRLALAMLTRSERQAESNSEADAAVRFVVGEFDQFLDIACVGDTQAAADFVAGRQRLGYRGHEESAVLERLENRRRYGVGLPEEIDVSDLDPDDRENWTEEQAERAERADLLGNRNRDGVAGLLGQLMGLCDEDQDDEDDQDEEGEEDDEDEDDDTGEDRDDEEDDDNDEGDKDDENDEAFAPPPARGRPGDSGTAAQPPEAAPTSTPDPTVAKPAAGPPPPGLLEDGRPPSGWVAPGR